MSLAERLFLLGHNPDSAGFQPFMTLPTLSTALAGAVLADLILNQQVCIDEYGLVRPWGTYARPPEQRSDRITDEVWQLIAAGRPREGQHGLYQPFPVRELINLLTPDIYPRIQAALTAAGVLTHTTRRLRSDRYTLTSERPASAVRAAVQYAVRGLERPRLDTMALCALIRAVMLTETLFLSFDQEETVRRLNDIVRQIMTCRQPYAGIADVAGAVEAVAADIVVAVYR